MYKKFLCCLLIVALVLTMGGVRLIFPVQAETMIGKEAKIYDTATLEDDFADNRVLVVLSNEASLKFRNYTSLDFPEISCSEVQDLSSASAARVQAKLQDVEIAAVSTEPSLMNQDVKVEEFTRILCLELDKPGKGNVLQAVRALEQREDVLYAGPDYAIQLATVTPSDPYYSTQWAPSKIDLPSAWDIETGSSSVRVGIIDSGIDGTHPDLVNNVSASLSRNFVNTSANSESLIDRYGLGTCIAGIVGAQHDNYAGVSGVCQDVTLVSLKTFDDDGFGYYSYIIAAINYAQSVNISILHMAFTITQDAEDTSPLLLQRAFDGFPGLIICGAGDGAYELGEFRSVYPASYTFKNMIVVAASTQGDGKGTFSNFGLVDVDLFAPGVYVASCASESICQDSNCRLSEHIDYGYHYYSSTGVASAYVAGVAALIFSAHPNASRDTVKAAILNGVDPVSAFNGKCVTGGRLNAYNALGYSALHTGSAYYDSYNSSKHWRYCSTCSYPVLENHVMNSFGQCSLCFYPNNT